MNQLFSAHAQAIARLFSDEVFEHEKAVAIVLRQLFVGDNHFLIEGFEMLFALSLGGE